MEARALVEVQRTAGRDVVTRLRSDPPLSLRRTPDAVYLVGSSAGPLGGDDLELRVRVGRGASLVLRSVAATLVLPGVTGAASCTTVDVEVAAGGHLVLAPEPQIVADGADHRSRTVVRLGRGASLSLVDQVVLGRDGEEGGSVVQELRVTRTGAPLVTTSTALGSRWPGASGPAGVDGARVVATVLRVGAAPLGEPASVDGVRGAVFELADDATMATGLSRSTVAMARWLGASSRSLSGTSSG